jgi:hypothetical protein
MMRDLDGLRVTCQDYMLMIWIDYYTLGFELDILVTRYLQSISTSYTKYYKSCLFCHASYSVSTLNPIQKVHPPSLY